MNKNNALPTATLIFSGERFVSLPKIADVLSRSVDPDGVLMMEDVSLSSLRLVDPEISVRLELSFENDETALLITIEKGDDDPARQLAALTHALASRVPVAHVVWPGSTVRIPRQQFVDGLSDMFGKPETAIGLIAPRRIRRPETVGTERPTSAPLPAAQHARMDHYAASMGGVRGSDTRYDAHVTAYEENLRCALRRCDTATLRLPQAQRQCAPRRLATWAVSIGVAAVSLPLALPLLAYNLVRGEDMRAAALTMGIAGFVMALHDTNILTTAL